MAKRIRHPKKNKAPEIVPTPKALPKVLGDVFSLGETDRIALLMQAGEIPGIGIRNGDLCAAFGAGLMGYQPRWVPMKTKKVLARIRRK